MLKWIASAGIAATLACGAGAAGAQNLEPAVGARQSLMALYGHYLGQLGAMAKGEVPYDAATADAAAKSLAALSTLDQSAMWPAGSDNGALGNKTRALPAIWATFPAIQEASQSFSTAAQGLAEAAGKDLDSLRGGMGPVGKACGGCHEVYRAPKS